MTKKLRITWMEQQRKVLMMKNKSCFWLLFLPGILLIRLIFSAAFWYVIGCVVLGGMYHEPRQLFCRSCWR